MRELEVLEMGSRELVAAYSSGYPIVTMQLKWAAVALAQTVLQPDAVGSRYGRMALKEG